MRLINREELVAEFEKNEDRICWREINQALALNRSVGIYMF
jgi:hypothetical protein